MSDSSTFQRHQRLLSRLSAEGNGLTVEELAAATGVCIKTIRRDLTLFLDNGIPLKQAIGPRGRKTWRVVGTYGDSAFQVPFDEATAMYLGLKLLQPWKGTLLGEAGHRLWRKLRRTFDKSVREYLDRIPGLLHVVAARDGRYAARSNLLDDLMRATEVQRVVRLTYQSQRSTEAVTYEVQPLSFLDYRHSIYLVAFAPHHGEVRHYKLDRMDAVEVTDATFVRPADFHPESHLSGSFGVFKGRSSKPVSIRIRFDREVARYVREKQWHSTQRLLENADGSLIAEFTLTALEEVAAWVLSFGSKAEILEPPELREAIAAEVRELAALYQPARTKPQRSRAGRSKAR